MYGYQSIPSPMESITNISDYVSDFLTDIWETFGIYDGKYLEEQTHKEEPWINARKGFALGERCTNIIEKENMKTFFKKVINVA